MQLIFLVGFMGSGKTTLGRQLAEVLNIPFMDTDQNIEQRFGATVSQLFAEKGEEFFRKEELKLVEELNSKTNMVIATGGGLPCYSNIMQRLNELGLTIYLKTSEETLFERLMLEMEDRPLLEGMGEFELKMFIQDKMREREPIYSQAEIILEEPEHSASALIHRLPQTS